MRGSARYKHGARYPIARILELGVWLSAAVLRYLAICELTSGTTEFVAGCVRFGVGVLLWNRLQNYMLLDRSCLPSRAPCLGWRLQQSALAAGTHGSVMQWAVRAAALP